jgi:hypothetical protein
MGLRQMFPVQMNRIVFINQRTVTTEAKVWAMAANRQLGKQAGADRSWIGKSGNQPTR